MIRRSLALPRRLTTLRSGTTRLVRGVCTVVRTIGIVAVVASLEWRGTESRGRLTSFCGATLGRSLAAWRQRPGNARITRWQQAFQPSLSDQCVPEIGLGTSTMLPLVHSASAAKLRPVVKRLLAMHPVVLSACDLRSRKIRGTLKDSFPDFLVKDEPLRIDVALKKEAPAVVYKLLKRLENHNSSAHWDWVRWRFARAPKTIAAVSVNELLFGAAEESTTIAKVADRNSWKVLWEVVDAQGACEWAPQDKRPAQARRFCEILKLCKPYTVQNAASVGVPGPEETGISTEATVLLPVVYYKARAGLGRWYATIGAQLSSKKMRSAAYGSTMVQLDATACFAQLVLNTFACQPNLNAAKVFRNYVDNRPEYHELVQNLTGCNTSSAKELFIRVLHGGYVKTWAQACGFANHEHITNQLEGDPMFAAFADCIPDVYKNVLSTTRGQIVLQELDNGPKHRHFSYVVQDLEARVMQYVQDVLVTNGFPTAALIHDCIGVFPRKGHGVVEYQELGELVTRQLNERHNISMVFHVESFPS